MKVRSLTLSTKSTKKKEKKESKNGEKDFKNQGYIGKKRGIWNFLYNLIVMCVIS